MPSTCFGVHHRENNSKKEIWPSVNKLSNSCLSILNAVLLFWCWFRTSKFMEWKWFCLICAFYLLKRLIVWHCSTFLSHIYTREQEIFLKKTMPQGSPKSLLPSWPSLKSSCNQSRGRILFRFTRIKIEYNSYNKLHNSVREIYSHISSGCCENRFSDSRRISSPEKAWSLCHHRHPSCNVVIL